MTHEEIQAALDDMQAAEVRWRHRRKWRFANMALLLFCVVVQLTAGYRSYKLRNQARSYSAEARRWVDQAKAYSDETTRRLVRVKANLDATAASLADTNQRSIKTIKLCASVADAQAKRK